MLLPDVNYRLEEIAKFLPMKIRELHDAEYAYQIRFSYLITHSGMGNAQAREAEAIATCNAEGLYQPLLDLRGEYKALYHEKECLIEISRNLRATQVGSYGSERLAES